MKKTLLLFASLFCLLASAQESPLRMRWGITVGLNGYNAHTLNLSGERGRLGGHIGARAELPLSAHASHWYAAGEAKLLLLRDHQQAYYFSYNFSGQDGKGSTQHYDYTMDAYYLNIPLHIGYKWALGRNVALFVDGGPYVAMGLFGKCKYANTVSGEGNAEKSYNTFGHSIGNRFEWGLGGNLGVELAKHYRLGISYDYGVKNIHYNQGGKDNNYNFSFIIGYIF